MSSPAIAIDTREPFHWKPAAALAAFVFVVHIVVNATSPYGIHRDELLYLAMGTHLRLFTMDFPPAIALIANAERLFGDSLIAIRLAPALAAAAIIMMAAAIAREFGGGRFAQLAAAVAVVDAWVVPAPGQSLPAGGVRSTLVDRRTFRARALRANARPALVDHDRCDRRIGAAHEVQHPVHWIRHPRGARDRRPRGAAHPRAVARARDRARDRQPEHHRPGPARISDRGADENVASESAGARQLRIVPVVAVPPWPLAVARARRRGVAPPVAARTAGPERGALLHRGLRHALPAARQSLLRGADLPHPVRGGRGVARIDRTVDARARGTRDGRRRDRALRPSHSAR